MPTTLRADGDELRLKLGGLGSDEFHHAKQIAASIPGRTYDPDKKEWVYPLTVDNATRLVHTIRVDADPVVLDLIRDAASKIAEELATRIGTDAPLQWPEADRLYPYQRAAVDFMVTNQRVLLADEMGLGKTPMGLAAVAENRMRHAAEWVDREPGRILVVCSNSVKRWWARATADWLGVEAAVIDGKDPATRQRQLDGGEQFVVVNWEKLRNPGAPGSMMPALGTVEWEAIIADAAHRAKNRKAQQAKALYKLHAPMQLALTGTPILNAPDELWSIMHWLDPASYSSYWRFYHAHVYFYEGFYGKVKTGVRNPDDLRFALRKVLVRRTKRQVLPELPAKTHQVIEVDLLPEQRWLYDQAENEFILEVEQALETRTLPSEQDTLKHALHTLADTGNPTKLSFLIPNAAAQCVRMRQIASTPALLGGADKSAKLDAAQDIILDAPDKQFVVFCWYKGTATRLAERLRKATKDHLTAAALTGDTPERDRDDLVQAFQAHNLRVLVCTIMAGGEGLTLTAADTAIFIERDWTPANNAQAEDRLHRVGQDRPVHIITLDAADTLDTGRIAPTNRMKGLIVASVLGAE